MKALPFREFHFENQVVRKYRETNVEKLTIKIQQCWKDDDKGGTDLGFGGCVYESAYILSDYIFRNQHLVRDKTSLELGSGLGLVSILCAKLGALKILATDGDDISADMTKSNAVSNSCSHIIETKKYLWNSGDAQVEELTKFDFILAADIVAIPYREHFQNLVKALEKIFGTNPKALFLLAYKNRHSQEQVFFKDLAASHRFQILKLPPSDLHQDFSSLKSASGESEYSIFCITSISTEAKD